MSAGPNIVLSPAWTGHPRSFFLKVFMVKPTRAWLIVDVTDVMFAVILKSLSINFHKHVGHSPLKLLLDYAQF